MMINAQYVLGAGALLLGLIGLLFKSYDSESRYRPLHIVTISIFLLAFFVELFFGNYYGPFFESAQYSLFVNGFILFLAVIIYLFMFVDNPKYGVTIDVLFVMVILGANLLVLASNFISLILAVELMSISSYGLVFFGKTARSMEGAMKYVVISFLSMVFMLFGVSLIYGGAGTLDFAGIAGVNYLPFIVGMVVFLAGLAYESTLVPFHMWAPDVYEASNPAVTALLTSILKAAGLIAMIRVFFFAFSAASLFIQVLFVFFALATVFLGSFMAMVQDRLKRILAYSSIAQAGFAFVGVSLLTTIGVAAAVFYIFTFAVADALMFLAYGVFERESVIYKKDAYKMPQISKITSFSFAIGLLSLAGFPPMMGFFGKFAIFASLLSNLYIVFAIVVFFAILISVFYYMNIIREMLYLKKSKNAVSTQQNLAAKEALVLSLVAAIFVGVIFVAV